MAKKKTAKKVAKTKQPNINEQILEVLMKTRSENDGLSSMIERALVTEIGKTNELLEKINQTLSLILYSQNEQTFKLIEALRNK